MRVERVLLLLICIFCAAAAVSALVLVFKQMEVAEALAEVRSVDRFINCKLLWLQKPDGLPDACQKFDYGVPKKR